MAKRKVALVPGDALFDDALPPGLRALAELHWTPAAVVSLGASWLVEHRARTVLDVGSGVGKFCTLAALETPLTCVGLEQRRALVEVARAVAQELGATRSSFVVGGLEQLESLGADALYLYNPFAENLEPDTIGIDATVELSPRRYAAEVRRVEEALARAPVGQLLLTLNGFGGRPPGAYRELRSASVGVDFLRLYQKG